MLGRTRNATFLSLWIYFSFFISPSRTAGTLEIRFEQYEVTYRRGVHHDGGDPSSVSMSPDPVWEEITPAPLASNNTSTPSPLPPAWQTPPTCDAPARYRFLLCIDRVGEPQECALGREDTGLTQVSQGLTGPDGSGHDIVMFDNMLRGMPNPLNNPLRYNVPSWPGSIQATFFVQCCGAEDTERCEEKISGELAVKPLTTQGLQPTRINITNQDGASMVLSVTLRCSQNFYGDNCTTFCRDDNQNVRVCHPETGQLVCRPGFSGPTCEEDVDECKLGVCLHGSTCNNVHGGFTCNCLTGSSGRLCQQRITTCDSRPCINGGTCEENLDSVDFRCACPPGWKGKQCQLVDDVTTSTTQSHVKAILKDKEDTPTAEPTDDWTIWYVGIALLALTVVVIIILIICVVWTSRKRRYPISELAKPDPPIIPVTGVAPASHFDNMVYLHDPEQIDLQPPTSNLYQRTLVTDDPYTNQRPLYQHRIEPDTPFEADDNDTCCSVVRREGGRAARENVYSTWGSVGGPEEEAYESVTPQKDEDKKKTLEIPENSETYRRESDPVPSTPSSRKESDPLFDFTKFNAFEAKPSELNVETPKENDEKDVPSLPKINYVPCVSEEKDEMSPTYRRESDPVSYFVLEDCTQNYDIVPPLPNQDPSDPSQKQMSVENPEYADHLAGPVYQAMNNPFLGDPSEPETHDRPSSVSSMDNDLVGDRRPSAVSTVSSVDSSVIRDRRSSAISSSSSDDSRSSSEFSNPYYDSVSPYANTQKLFSQNSTPSVSDQAYAPNTSFKKPCPTPRTSIVPGPEEQASEKEDNSSSEPSSPSIENLFPRKDSIPEGYSPFSEQRSEIQPKINTKLQDDPVSRAVFLPEYPIPRNNSAPDLEPYRKISIPVVEDPPPGWRKNSEITLPFIGKRRKSGDLLARTTSGSVPTEWPAENSRKKKYSYDLST